jgi:hypothetical protein
MNSSIRAATLAALGLLSAAPLALSRPAAADASVNGSLRTTLLDCAGGDALVNGNNNRLVFNGACRSLRINGGGNTVQIDLVPGGSIAVEGDGNRVTYAPIVPAAQVSAQGNQNQIAAGAPTQASLLLTPALPAPPPVAVTPPPPLPAAATLVLDGDMQSRDMACAGQNVLIRGNNGNFVLRGGCRSLTVQGGNNVIQAELQPGARVDIGGTAVTLHYTLTGEGPPPVVSVAPGSQVTQVTRTTGPTVITQQ